MKIYGNDLPSIVESLYLGLERTDYAREYDIIVNPEKVTYIIRKTVIINKFSYPESNIKILLGNGCNIVSRVREGENIYYDPYRLKLNTGIMWNGEVIETLSEDISEAYYSIDDQTLYFPKVRTYREIPVIEGGYNYLAYILHQVGQCVWKNDLIHQDFDLVKTKKGRW